MLWVFLLMSSFSSITSRFHLSFVSHSSMTDRHFELAVSFLFRILCDHSLLCNFFPNCYRNFCFDSIFIPKLNSIAYAWSSFVCEAKRMLKSLNRIDIEKVMFRRRRKKKESCNNNKWFHFNLWNTIKFSTLKCINTWS